MPVIVKAVRQAAKGIALFELSAEDGGRLRDFAPGAHIDLYLPNGMKRQYSLIDSEPGQYAICVKRENNGRGGSSYLHDHVRVGTRVHVGGPRNNFPLAESATHSIFIAGGIGITPMFSMVRRLESLGASWKLYYCARSREEAALAECLEEMGDRVTFRSDDENEGHINIRGLIGCPHPSVHLYCCGPRPMLDAFRNATIDWPATNIHVEHFAPAEPPATAGGFRVTFARSGKEAFVPAGMSILQVAQAYGIRVEHGCLQGTCGACETRVLDGVPDHRDALLTPMERTANKSMMVCCSGSLSDSLTLDI